MCCRCLRAWRCVGLAGCGTATSGGSSAVTVTGSTLTSYAGQPPRALAARRPTDVLDAEKLALKQAGGRAGKFTVVLRPVDGKEISDNARTAIQDKTTIAYLGELAARDVAGLGARSQPAGRAAGQPGRHRRLSDPVDAGRPGSPTKFYPSRSTYHETFARVVANDCAGGQGAGRRRCKRRQVSKLYVANDGQPYGDTVASRSPPTPARPASRRSRAPAAPPRSQSSGAEALFYGASDTSPTARKAAATLLDNVSPSAPDRQAVRARPASTTPASWPA